MERLLSSFIYVVLRLTGAIPRPVALSITNFTGNIWFAVDRRHRKMAIDNLNRAFGNEKSSEEIKNIAKENFRQLTRLLFEIGWSLSLEKHDLARYVRIEGFDNVHRAFREKKGVLFLTAHMGSWELLTLVPALIPYTVHDIYRPLDFPPLERLFVRFRTRFGLKLIAKNGALRKMLRALSKNEGIAVPLDQSVWARDGVYAEFFGESVSTSKGLGYIAMKTGAPVIPVFMIRENGKYVVVFKKRVPFLYTGDDEKDLLINTSACNLVIENIIREFPEQWFWVHNRWKRTAEKGKELK